MRVAGHQDHGSVKPGFVTPDRTHVSALPARSKLSVSIGSKWSWAGRPKGGPFPISLPSPCIFGIVADVIDPKPHAQSIGGRRTRLTPWVDTAGDPEPRQAAIN